MRRTYPERTSSRWLGTSASAGSSRRVRRNSEDILVNTLASVANAPGPTRGPVRAGWLDLPGADPAAALGDQVGRRRRPAARAGPAVLARAERGPQAARRRPGRAGRRPAGQPDRARGVRSPGLRGGPQRRALDLADRAGAAALHRRALRRTGLPVAARGRRRPGRRAPRGRFGPVRPGTRVGPGAGLPALGGVHAARAYRADHSVAPAAGADPGRGGRAGGRSALGVVRRAGP